MSLAVKAAVCVPRHQGGLPGSEQLSLPEFQLMTGATLSSIKVRLTTLRLPAWSLTRRLKFVEPLDVTVPEPGVGHPPL